MTTCPICKSEATALNRTGDAEGFDCPQHRKFKVAGSVFATRSDATPEQWETALNRARARQPNEWAPVIQDGDF
jgi:hypothetical protein